MRKYISIIIIFVVLFSCDKESKIENEISKTQVNFDVERFDKAFFNASPSNLQQLKEAFPFMFSKRINDSVWIHKMEDTLQQQLFQEIENKFQNIKPIEDDITQLFQHLKYYDKTFREPRIVTFSDYVDYRNKVIVTDTIVLIALDTYFGSDHEFYQGIPKYISQNLNVDQLASDMATEYSKKYSFQIKNSTFLDDIIGFGKQLYFKDKMIPFKSDAIKIGYTQEQLDWAIANESYIWTYFVEKEMLFSTDRSLVNRFIAPAPFSKFYLELDTESPGRLGQFIGWQIVRAYMEQNDTPFLKMMQMEADEIYNNVKYKPKK